MSQYFNALKWKICPLFLVIFQAVFHMVVCRDGLFWCGDKQEESFIAIRGQNISRRFRLENGLTETQTLVWAKVVEDRLSDFIDNTSDNQGRYKLKKVPAENAIDLFIAFTEQSDSGKHIIKIHEGAQALCSVVVFNLTIESTEPVCSTLLDQESGRLQMSCQWFQVIEGDRAQLLAGNQVVYEYETQRMSSQRDFNSTNKFSVYLSSDMAYEHIVPNTCLISNNLRNSNKTCEFLRVQNHAIRNDQTASQHFKFECCPVKEADVVSWWYSNGSSLCSLNLPAGISVGNKERMFFFCGVQHGNLTIRVYSTGNVLFSDVKEYNLFLSPVLEGQTNAIGHSGCENILLNATRIKNGYHLNDDQEVNMTSTQGNTGETKVSLDAPGTDQTINAVPTWLWVFLVLSVTFCLTTGFANCYYFALRKYRYHFRKGMNNGIEMNSVASTGDARAQSRDVANSQTQPLQVCMEHNPQGAVAHTGALDQGEQRTERNTQFPKHRDEPPSLHSQLQFGESESSCIANCPLNHDSIAEDHKGAGRRPTTCSKASTNEHKGSDVASAKNNDIAYCSVDEVKDTPTDIAKERKSSQAASAMYPKQSSKCQEAHRDHVSGNASTSSPLTSETSKLKKKVPGASRGLDTLYAKPDMSRKTRKVTCLEPDCDYPKNPCPTRDLDPPLDLHCSDSIVQGHGDLYGNMITNPTDEMIDEGNLYINGSGHTLL